MLVPSVQIYALTATTKLRRPAQCTDLSLEGEHAAPAWHLSLTLSSLTAASLPSVPSNSMCMIQKHGNLHYMHSTF